MLSEAAGSGLPVTQQIASSCSDSPDKGERRGEELFNQTAEAMGDKCREPGIRCRNQTNIHHEVPVLPVPFLSTR